MMNPQPQQQTTPVTIIHLQPRRPSPVAADNNDDISDANQKQRRHRGGRARRIWKRWSTRNPTLATLLMVFVGLCTTCMIVEQIGGGSGSNDNYHLSLRTVRRAKALLQQARHREQDDNNNESGEETEIREGGARQQERESLPQAGDDLRSHRDKQGQQHGHNRDEKPAYDHHLGWKNMFGRGGGDDDEEEDNGRHPKRYRMKDVHEILDQLDEDITTNKDGGIRWSAPYLMLPPIASLAGRQLQAQNDDQEMTRGQHRKDAVNPREVDIKSEFFKVQRKYQSSMAWEAEYKSLTEDEMKPPVDYVTHAYDYPELRSELPDLHDHGRDYPDYPPLRPLGDLMKDWPQDNDFPGAHQRPIREGLYHFNYSNPAELEMARKFRDAELPFKLYDVPEVTAATKKWTDEYVAENFDGGRRGLRNIAGGGGGGDLLGTLFGKRKPIKESYSEYSAPPPPASGMCQESPNNFFAFFQPNLWDVKSMGLPPVRTNDWTFAHWSKHARYADAVALNASKPHFYWQSGVPREERTQPKSHWTFVSRDLPSFSSPTKTFFVFEPESQKGIQCRFGERGVVAATHYDSGRNMIAMVTGAKRYILAPPKECSSLGIVPWKFNSEFRHSLLNFGHINYMNEAPASSSATELDDGEEEEKGDIGRRKRQWKGDHMSQVEREWMEIASTSRAIETVLKAGEVLYIPSHWFHYIVSIQKSAQCNVRSGVHDEGTPAFGGKLDVKTCGRLSPQEADIH